MTIQITEETTPEIIHASCDAGAVAGKVYTRGVTTNSDNGVTMDGFHRLSPVWEAMAERGMVLCLHGEHAGQEVFCLDREEQFLATLMGLSQTFQDLRIVLEHVTTEAAVNCVLTLGDNVAATITVHHLELTLDHIIGGSLDPHAFCKPVAKRPQDREALLGAALRAHPKFFFGSDSAPHTRAAKHGDGCAGIFSAPVALEVLAEIFARDDALDRLEAFVSLNGARFYGLPVNEGFIELEAGVWTVPAMYGDVVPYRASKSVGWRRVQPL
jgi:dihydroorotase